MDPDFDTMNETDVREIIVRPLLDRLGYKHGTVANIRTEVPLRYSRVILGRKNEKRDPPVAGKADYLCDAVSYGRWVVEVKSPKTEITQDDVEQAYSYCAHPEISGSYFLITNGRTFRLYVASKLDEPILAWSFAETERHVFTLFNILGYQAIKKLSDLLKADVNKPLGKGLRSAAKIVGGQVRYGAHRSTHPLMSQDGMNGTIGSVTGVKVGRADDGRLHAKVSVLSPYQTLANLNKLAGVDDFDFFSSDEYVSDDISRPTIFQNVIEGNLPVGVKARLLPTLPEFPVPFGFRVVSFTEAAGYLNDDKFEGVVFFDYDYQLVRGPLTGIPKLDELVATMPLTARIEGEAEFSLIFK